MSSFTDAIGIIVDKILMSDFIFNYKAKSLKKGVEFGSEETKKFCEIELDYLSKERITKTKNRKIADYFIALSTALNHSISPKHFKKFYTYLIINDGKIELNQDNLKRLNSTNNSFKFLGLLFALILVILSCLSANQGSSFLIPVFGIFMLFFIAFFSSQIIHKNELKEFKEITEKYNNQL